MKMVLPANIMILGMHVCVCVCVYVCVGVCVYACVYSKCLRYVWGGR